jgi:Na+/proline symporter
MGGPRSRMGGQGAAVVESPPMPASLLLLAIVIAYFGLLLWVARWATKRGGAANNESFFIGNRSSHWLLVAFGMIGTSLSGVTFISVPGSVGTNAFSYFQIALGQFVGYALIAFVLLPLYYRLRLTSIYAYLGSRFGGEAQRTGSIFFIVSRLLGATARLYLVVRVLHDGLLAPLGLPFWLAAAAFVLVILLYTLDGGVKAIVWTDTLQTSGMLIGLVACGWLVLDALQLAPAQAWALMSEQGLNQVFHHDPDSRLFWAKQLVAGMAIAVAMTGLDQEMMQKNISVPRLADAQKNMLLMSTLMLGVVFLFLLLGGLLQLYALQTGMAQRGDALFPAVVLHHLPLLAQGIFVIALVSALLPSADGALTALTASSCLDLLRLNERKDWDEARRTQIRRRVHLGFAAAFFALVMLFRWVDDPSMIGLILKLAGYTYGPLLGLFLFGLLSRRVPAGRAVLPVALAAPLLCWLVDVNQAKLFGSYQIGLELLLLNAAFTMAGLWLASRGQARAVTA